MTTEQTKKMLEPSSKFPAWTAEDLKAGLKGLNKNTIPISVGEIKVAKVITTRAIYDRVSVLRDETGLWIEYFDGKNWKEDFVSLWQVITFRSYEN